MNFKIWNHWTDLHNKNHIPVPFNNEGIFKRLSDFSWAHHTQISVDNIFIRAKIQGFNIQDSHWDSLKINHFEGVILLPSILYKHSLDTFCITVSIRYRCVNSAALDMNDTVPSF